MTEATPPGWHMASVGEVARYVRGVTYQKEHARQQPSEGLVPVLRANNIGVRLIFEDLVYVPSRFVSDEQRVRDGDLVIAMSSGSKSVVGKAAMASRPPEIGFGAFCGVLRPSEGVHPRYLGLYFQTKAYRNSVSELSKGVNINNLKAEHLLDQPLPLPPFQEQQRIVSRIEELFSEIDEGERALERVGRLVERYRQSVLKAAVTGELTRGWRASRAPTVDWDAQLQELRQGSWFAARKVAAAKAGDYPEPTRPKIGLDIELPESWALLSVEAATLAERPIAYGVLQPGPDSEDGVPMVRVCDVIDGQVQTGSLKRVAPEVVSQFPRTRLRGGEVLLTIVGTIGRTGIVPATLAGANVARAVAVLCAQPGVRAQWLELCLREERMRQLLTGNSREVARKTLNLEQLRECAIPVPSIDEQDEAISRARAMLSGADATATDLVRQAKAAEALRQSILKAAFSGQLVPQDPNDEPASALLARLAAQPADAQATPRRRGRPTGRRLSQPNPEVAD
jgi:type I restriction enzyme S subunit